MNDAASGLQGRIADLLERFARGPALLRESLRGLSGEDLQLRRQPGKWSIKEIAIHLADAEILGAFRLKRALAEEGATLPAYDQDAWAARLRYADLDLEPYLLLFEGLRQSSTAVLRRAAEADWQRTAVHPKRGPVTLLDLVELYARHAESHVEQIWETRRVHGR